jgi:hypothetical protein
MHHIWRAESDGVRRRPMTGAIFPCRRSVCCNVRCSWTCMVMYASSSPTGCYKTGINVFHKYSAMYSLIFTTRFRTMNLYEKIDIIYGFICIMYLCSIYIKTGFDAEVLDIYVLNSDRWILELLICARLTKLDLPRARGVHFYSFDAELHLVIPVSADMLQCC